MISGLSSQVWRLVGGTVLVGIEVFTRKSSSLSLFVLGLTEFYTSHKPLALFLLGIIPRMDPRPWIYQTSHLT